MTQPEELVLEGKAVRLEALGHHHVDGLVKASAMDPPLYHWTPVPQGRAEMIAYVETALAARRAGTAAPFATLRASTGEVLGSTRFYQIESWAWPDGHPRHGLKTPDVCEIGWTWLARPAIRTGINHEAKLLMLTYAFEEWKVLRVCLHTDARNERSRAAMERIGAKFEGILRAHKIATDAIARDSARYSIIAEEWPDLKRRLTAERDRRPVVSR